MHVKTFSASRDFLGHLLIELGDDYLAFVVGLVPVSRNFVRNRRTLQRTGAIDDMLSKVAAIFEQEVDDMVDGLTSLLEPIIMVVLGVLVGGMVVAMYLPIFKLGSVIH
jgi:hypothetical protein